MAEMDTRTTEDPPAAGSAGTPSAAATERLVDRFGGARAMAAKLKMPASIVQGWMKRGAIPATHHSDILAAAEKHAIPLEIIDVAATEPAGMDGAGTGPDSPAPPPSLRRAPGAWIALAVGPLATLALLLTFGGLYIVKQKTADLSHRVNELSEQNSKLETRLTRLESLELAAPVAAADNTRHAAEPAEASQIAALSQKMDNMRQSSGAEGVLGQTVGGLQQTVAALQTNLQALSQSMDTTRAKVGELDTQMAERRTENAQQFAILLSIDQLRIAAASSQPFDSELDAARAVSHDDPAVMKVLDTLSPFAADGVPTLNELRAEFADRASEIVRSNVVGDGHSWYRQSLWRLAQVISVRKVSTGPNDKNTPEHDVAHAESKLEEDDLAGAVAALKDLTGLPQDVASGWIAAAQGRIAVDAGLTSLGEIAVARLETFQSTLGAKP